MTKPPDTRFEQKLRNFEKALNALEKSLATPVKEPRDLSGIVKDFEIVYELGWKALKTFLEKQGHQTQSARDTFSEAYRLNYLSEQNVWLEIIEDRNLTVHTYDEQFAQELCERIKKRYVLAFQALLALLRKQ